jgi:hypothetical protein
MEQPIPNVSRSDVERIVLRDFGNADASTALAILDEYRSSGSSPTRVQLAVLKLAAGSLDALRREVDTAKHDYRDVLASAEYPRYSREIGFDEVLDSFRQAVINEDWRQYQSWLGG